MHTKGLGSRKLSFGHLDEGEKRLPVFHPHQPLLDSFPLSKHRESMSEHISWSPKCAGGKKRLRQLGNSSASLEALASTDLVMALVSLQKLMDPIE